VANNWNGDVNQGCGDMSMGKEHTPSDKLRSASEHHHRWGREMPLHRSRSGVCRVCLMETTCGSWKDRWRGGERLG
jgi:hypothetical protein